jgi:hypothetical protein
VHRWWLPLFVALLGSCVTEKGWPDRAAKVSCKFAKRCSTSQFYFTFDDMADCIDSTQDQFRAQEDFQEDNCTFDKKQARDCLKALRGSCKAIGKDYDALYQACFEVWDCGGEALDTGETTGGGGTFTF